MNEEPTQIHLSLRWHILHIIAGGFAGGISYWPMTIQVVIPIFKQGDKVLDVMELFSSSLMETIAFGLFLVGLPLLAITGLLGFQGGKLAYKIKRSRIAAFLGAVVGGVVATFFVSMAFVLVFATSWR